MQLQEQDITRTIISERFVTENIYSLFPDSIFLDKNFAIVGMSENIYTSLQYAVGSLTGKPLAELQPQGNLEHRVRQLLTKGYFNNETTALCTSGQRLINYSISGFYLGLLTDCSGFIVLRCVQKGEIEAMERKVSEAKAHIDNFVYRAAHDLRGPLATMLGLLNLLKIRDNNTEVDRFVDMIEMHGKKLDERLHQIVYLSKIDEQIAAPKYQFSFSNLETNLRRIIEQNAFVDFLDFKVVSAKQKVTGFNEIHLYSILSNIVQYILSLRTCGTDSSITLTANETYNGLTISVKAQGFVTDPEIQSNMRDMDVGRYSQLLQSSKFINLFAAQKIALQSKAFISLDQLRNDCEQITVWMPRSTQEKGLTNR